MDKTNMKVASLSAEQVNAIKKYEQEFKAKYGQDIILVALND